MRTYIRHGRVVRDQRTLRVDIPEFYDPFWFIKGTSIEKMVMAEFVRRGIYFEYRPQRNFLGGIVDPTWEADFALPQHRIWLEINGAYFHTLPGQMKSDAMRGAAVTMAGWKYLAWWEWDIRDRLQWLFDQQPEFYVVEKAKQKVRRDNTGYGFYSGAKVDQLAGLRKALSNRGNKDVFTGGIVRRPGRRPK